MGIQANVNQGLEVHGELTEGAATTSRVPLRQQEDNAAVTLGLDEYLVLVLLALHSDAAGEIVVFFDIDDLASSEAILAADDSANTFTVAGDRTREFAADRTFTVANSTGNNGSYTSTGAELDADGNTVISVSSVTDGTDDGDITSDPVERPGSRIWKGDAGGSDTGVVLGWPTVGNGRRGRTGEGVYVTAPGTDDVSVVVDALRRRDLDKTTAAGTPIHDPR